MQRTTAKNERLLMPFQKIFQQIMNSRAATSIMKPQKKNNASRSNYDD